MERVDHFVGAAGNWHDDFEIQSFALEETLAISHHDRECVDAAECGIGCSIAQHDRLGPGGRGKRRDKKKHN
jgi:hypothetical protein